MQPVVSDLSQNLESDSFYDLSSLLESLVVLPFGGTKLFQVLLEMFNDAELAVPDKLLAKLQEVNQASEKRKSTTVTGKPTMNAKSTQTSDENHSVNYSSS